MQDLILYPPTLPSTGTAWSAITGTPTTLGGYGITDAAAKIQTQEMFIVYFENPSNKTYHILAESAQAGTVTTVATYAQTGTCTLTIALNGVPLGGGSNAVSNSAVITSHSSNNTFAAGAYIDTIITANSTCRDISLTIKYTRTYS